MQILAIDPGPKESAFIEYQQGRIGKFGKVGNDELKKILKFHACNSRSSIVIEMIASYGMAVGKDVFETCVWIGRFIEVSNGKVNRVFRKEVKMHLCGSPRAKDANIRQALIDLYGETKQEAIGTKKQPGPLYGVSGDVWAALGVAVTYEARLKSKPL